MKLKHVESGLLVNLIKTKKPKMSLHRGRTWDSFRIKLEKNEVEVFLDTTWGFYGYLNITGKWYKLSLMSIEDAMYDLWIGDNYFVIYNKSDEK